MRKIFLMLFMLLLSSCYIVVKDSEIEKLQLQNEILIEKLIIFGEQNESLNEMLDVLIKRHKELLKELEESKTKVLL